MEQYIIDINKTMYIGINNINNKFCYLIGAYQRLHSSPFLNSLFNVQTHTPQPSNDEIKITSKMIKLADIILKPLEVYATINRDNYVEIHLKLNEAFKNVIDNVLADDLKDGGNPDVVIRSILLPAICIRFGIETVGRVINEIYFNNVKLNWLEYSINMFKHVIKSEVEEQGFKQISNLIAKTYKNKPSTINDDFDLKITTISIELDNGNIPGHCVCIAFGTTNILNEPYLYIIDDAATIIKYDVYFNSFSNRITKIDIIDCPKKAEELIKNDFNHVQRRLYRDVIIVLAENENIRYFGGATNLNIKFTTLNIVLIVINVILVCVIVIIILSNVYKKYKYNKQIETYKLKIETYKSKIETCKSKIESYEESNVVGMSVEQTEPIGITGPVRPTGPVEQVKPVEQVEPKQTTTTNILNKSVVSRLLKPKPGLYKNLNLQFSQ